MLTIGSLTIEVLTGKTGRLLAVRGGIYGVETLVTADDLLSLSRYLAREAEKLTNTKGD